jgi:hypothetical protein
MTGFDFFVDLAVTGTVLGLDHTSTPEAVHAVFGGEIGVSGSSGLVEFGWYERRCTYFGAQVHRLDLYRRKGLIEQQLVERYGTFPDRVDVDELREAVAGQGVPLVEVPYHDEDWVMFWSPVSRMGVLAERGTRSVEKQLGPSHYDKPRRQKKFRAYAEHLLPLSTGERERWYVKRAEDTPYWWNSLAAGTYGDDTADWRRLRLAIHRTATARGVHPADKAAVAEVELLLAVDEPPDDAVRRWLATAAMPTPGDIAAARKLRNEIHRVEPSLPRLRNPRLSAALSEWATVKPLLLAEQGN